jgi:octaprenyl-diphosphate synthase
MPDITIPAPSSCAAADSSGPDIQSIYAPIREDLERLEDEIGLLSESSHPFIQEATSYLLRNSGKRLRPALLILSSRMAGYQGETHFVLSALVETIHTASLIHDDIIDNAALRRGQATSHLRWGPQISVLLGDYLYIKALQLSLDFKDERIVRSLARASAEMIEGVLLECALSHDPDTSEEDYLEIITKKTAALFRAGCAIGGILGGQPQERIEDLAQFGAGFGITFQMVDDYLDFVGDAKDLGKPILRDLAEGRITLPLITALRRAEPARRERMAALIRSGTFSASARDEILAFVTSDGALDETRRKASQRMKESLPCLDRFPDSVFKESLQSLAAFILDRTY